MTCATTNRLGGIACKVQARTSAGVNSSIALIPEEDHDEQDEQSKTICLSVPLAAGAVFVAPTASANYAVVKVFDTPEVQYINVRNTADTSSNENIIDTISAGSFVWPMCWISGSAVPSPFSGQPASTIWYRIPGYPTGLVSHAYLDTGGNDSRDELY